jgi:4-hydroxy-tetrahydrodipicolinate reductase
MRLVIVGAAGRMGLAIVRGCAVDPGVRVVGAVDHAGSAAIGRDLGALAGIGSLGVPVLDDLEAALSAATEPADVVIDFSNPSATASHLATCAARGVAVLVGTTGLDAGVDPVAAAAAQRVPVLIAPNTSIGVTLLIELVRAAARALPAAYDIEIVESHHRAKRDAPSGTALALGRAAAEGRGASLEALRLPDVRDGLRVEGGIGFAVLRGGDIVGEHELRFVGTGEAITLGHRATDRAIFARGALQAARWLVGRPAGRYEMLDVIGLKTIG